MGPGHFVWDEMGDSVSILEKSEKARIDADGSVAEETLCVPDVEVVDAPSPDLATNE